MFLCFFSHGLISLPCPLESVFSALLTLTEIPHHGRRLCPYLTSSVFFMLHRLYYSVTIGFWPLFRTEDEWPDQLSRVWGDAKLYNSLMFKGKLTLRDFQKSFIYILFQF